MTRINRHYAAILFLLCLTGPALFSVNPSAAETLVINEFMADNASIIADYYGEYDDWIELYNSSTSAISLSGYYLTDDSSAPTQWAFPADASIAAGGYLIVWADKDTDQTEGLHAGFKLSADGEGIYLIGTDQKTIIDQVTFGAQEEDVSMGRYPSGTGNFVKMTPTFQAENIPVVPGDIDGNTVADLSDAILTLQILCGIATSASVLLDADVNDDDKIGIEECLFILRGLVASDDTGEDDSGTTLIQLLGDSITVQGDGATATGSSVTISSAGTYSISGTLTNGQIVVDTEDQETVLLILNGINITNATNAPIYIASAEETVITLAENTENYLTDGSSYTFADPEEDEPNAALFSKDDLNIEGSGSLVVNGKYNDGIASKDDLVISGGVITVTAADDGIRGKDQLVVKGGSITVNAGGDGFKSDNEDADKGIVSIEAGAVSITSGGDAIQAENNVIIADGEITLTSGGGSSASVSDDDSAKGVKGNSGVTVSGGALTINSADDAVHSNGSIVIGGGSFAISSGDDGIHADTSLTIDGGDIKITKCYEGIESELITINNGEIHIVSSDDAVNVAGGVDESGMGGWPGGISSGGDYWLYINGGYIAANASGDGIDVNGSVVMTDGVVIVNGPTANDNGALDYDGSFRITGGFLVAAGSSGMAQAPGSTSTQNSLLLNYNSTKSAGTLIHIQTGTSGILTFAPSKTYQSVAFSSPKLATGFSYDVYYGGSSTGEVKDGLYENGTYTPGTKYTTFTVSGTVTTVGNTSPRP